MSTQGFVAKLSVGQFAERFRDEMIPLSNTFSYFCASVPMSEEELKEYLEEPIAALPAAIAAALPRISIILVPYLERAETPRNGAIKPGAELVSMEKPPDDLLSWASQVRLNNQEVLIFALKDQNVAEYHYRFYRLIAALTADRWSEETQMQYSTLLREELNASVHGEVDEESWTAKQALNGRHKGARKDSRSFREYVRQSFIDTLTLYLHGICCDIDVDTGPRQLPSRYLRKRLKLLQTLYPQPNGYAVFPEDLKEQ
ncbi:MAG TPA: hypothetical protein VMJ34_03540 [Bryobacteraceae bacterium]|nr:hypothetical protein [Bryobacteraceae bacterium]